MYNGAIVSEQIRTFGIEATEKFCEMEAKKYEILAQSLPEGSEEAREAFYERDWWSYAKEELSRKINIKLK